MKSIAQREAMLVTHADNNEVRQFIELGESQGYSFQEIPWHQYRLDSSAVYNHPCVFLIGKKRAHEVARSMAGHRPEAVELLVSHDRRLLEFPDLLQLGHRLLIAPFRSSELASQLTSVFESSQVEERVSGLMAANIIGESDSLGRLLKHIARIARYDAPALLKGETGTGKELVARALHYESPRCDKPFVPANCGALNDELLLGELFGYEKGAFTDAKSAHAGYVQQAHGGTLFLDEVDSLTPRAQSALLRFLQEQEYRPLGSEKVHRADVRIISATNQNLNDLVAKGLFREDLFYRLHILDVDIPPLRERENDVAILADYFLEKFSVRYNEPCKYLHPRTLAWMKSYDWPGNVRELENYIYRVAVLAEGQVVDVGNVKGNPVSQEDGMADDELHSGSHTFQEAKAAVVNHFERQYLEDLMQQVAGNVSEAARQAGTERRVLGRLLKKHGIERSQYSQSAL